MMRGFDSIESMNADELLVKRKKGSKKFVIGAFVIGAMFFLVGILIGFFSHESQHLPNPSTAKPEILEPTSFIIQNVEISFLQNALQNFSSRVRMAGTESNAELAETIKYMWLSSGLDNVHIATYNVLLSFPNQSDPNKVEIINKTSGNVVFTSDTFESGLRAEDKNLSFISYNDFSPAGIVMGSIVYVNYGTVEDFDYITRNLSINLKNMVVIVRLGKISCAKKVYNAELYNASAVILYSDPADVNKVIDEKGSEAPYPKSWWLPNRGIPRETVYRDFGDPDTPGYPSNNYTIRLEKSKRSLAKIPCQPISYSDASHLLSNLSGPLSPINWHGSLPVEYRIGPGYESSPEIEIKLTVNNYLTTQPIKNVIGAIKGKEEPDRYIILGNHHDAWVYGSVDPQSGNAALAQVVKIFGNLLSKGFRPRRTLIFCSWDASEAGLIGSTEWVEENLKILTERAVAYLNIHMLVQGNFSFEAVTSPMLQDAIYTVAKQVPSPNKEFRTLYDVWLSTSANVTMDKKEPRVSYVLRSGSDNEIFYQRLGVSSADFNYVFDSKKYPITTYPLHHSAYDDYFSYENFHDPGMKLAKLMTQFWGLLAYYMANVPVLPMKVTRFSAAVNYFIADLVQWYKAIWTKNNIHFEQLVSAAMNFTEAANNFESHMSAEKDLENNPLRLRIYNDQIMQMERAFIVQESSADKPIFRHIIFSTSAHDSETDAFFPGICEAMKNIERGNDHWTQLKKEIFLATFSLQSATNFLSVDWMV